MSYKGPRAKLSRALGVPLTPKSALIIQKRPNPPGQHGARRRGSRSDYGLQLLEKQRLRFQYNVSERQLRKYFVIAKKMKGSTDECLVKVLESRLDNVVYRSGFAPTIYAARQLVSHGHCLVNGKKVDVASQLIGSDDVVSIREKSKGLLAIKEALSRANRPSYIETDTSALTTRFVRSPEGHEIPIVCNVQMVVEYYSR
jgi:small subunit ribosomal protein S4